MTKTQMSLRVKFIESLLKEINRRFDFTDSDRKHWQKKGGVNYVSELDLKIDQFISSEIRKSFPGEAVISEEGSNHQRFDSFWVVDPLDGTHNFLMGLREFGIQLAFCSQNKVLTGGILLPTLGEKWVMTKGGGAWLNGERLKKPPPSFRPFVFNGTSLRRVSDAYLALLKQIDRLDFSVRVMGCAATDFVFLAKARGLVILEKFYLWDVAPGVLLLQELGAKVVDLKGKKWTTKSSSLLVIHEIEKSKEKKLHELLADYHNKM